MDDEALIQRVHHLRQVERLSLRQIAGTLEIDRKKVRRILKGTELARPAPKPGVLDPFMSLIAQWYKDYPRLMALQVYERLKAYGYEGSYRTVVRWSREYRQVKPAVYHPLTFLPGEEAQVDWFFFNDEHVGPVAGFVYILSWSRYAWGIFYPRASFEFFLAGHLECFKHLGGVAHRHRYDNTKSVVIRRVPNIQYNPQFLDFARFFGFSLFACNPNSGHEKGRVERLVRDARAALYGKTFKDLADLNAQFHGWLGARNKTVHRVTGKAPLELLPQERLIRLPGLPYLPRKVLAAVVSKTALVEFDNNKYSVPTTCASKAVEVMAYPEHVEIWLSGQKIATHKRSFARRETIQNPLHAQKLLDWSPKFKYPRILQLMTSMDETFRQFIENQQDDASRLTVAYQLFTLIRNHSKSVILSAVREQNTTGVYKIKALFSRLNLPAAAEPQAVWPADTTLLNLKYQERDLNDYDPR